MCGGGGGGGGGQQVINQVEYTDLLGNKQVVNESEYGKTMGLNPLTAGTRLQAIIANPEEAKKYSAMGKSGDLLYPGGKKPDRPVYRSFVGTNVTAPETDPSMERRDSLATGEGTLPESGQVPTQMTGEETFGGEVGTGETSFGRRALLSGEGQLATTLGPTYTPEQGTLPTPTGNPDLQTDPNVPPVSPTESVAPDVNYIVPTTERKEQVISFVPNDPNAPFVARGPISSNLVNRRTGFGNGIIIA